jgi:hypothetical protein
MKREGDNSHHDDHRSEDSHDVAIAPRGLTYWRPFKVFVAHGCSSLRMFRNRLCSSRRRSAIR